MTGRGVRVWCVLEESATIACHCIYIDLLYWPEAWCSVIMTSVTAVIYHFIAVRCVHLCLLLNRVLHRLLMCLQFWLHLFTSCGRGPCPTHFGNIRTVWSRTRAQVYVCVDWTACTPYAETLKLFSLLFVRHAHKNGTEPAQVCAFLCCWSALLLLSVYSSSCSPSLSYVPCTLIYMHNKAACIVNVCPKCICEWCLWKMKSAGRPFSPPCKGVGCTPISCRTLYCSLALNSIAS